MITLTTLNEFPPCLQAIFEGSKCACPNCRKNDANLINRLIGEDPMKDVNRPSHYQSDEGIEAIDVIEAFQLNFNLGNVIKYILRAGKKEDEVKDLSKALWYLRREIKNIELEEDEEC